MGSTWTVMADALERTETPGHAPLIHLVTLDELDDTDLPPAVRDIAQRLPHARFSFCEELTQGCVGIVRLPALGGNPTRRLRFLFLLEAERLVLVDAAGTLPPLVEAIARDGRACSGCLDVLVGIIADAVADHHDHLARLHDELEGIEEDIVEERPCDRRLLVRIRRTTLSASSVYGDLADVLDAVAGAVAPDARARDAVPRIARLSHTLDRLERALEDIQSLSLDLANLYQESVDVRQNRIMQWLTVVATIFMPLTFITSWYGMNFDDLVMPRTSGGYLVVCLACLAIAALEVAWFRRRGWLTFGRTRHRPEDGRRPGASRPSARHRRPRQS